MSILLKNIKIVDKQSSWNGKKANLLIEKGMIESFQGEKAEKTMDMEGCMVTPSWVDLNAHFNEPGFEYKENIESGLQVAARGGFSDVQIIPNTHPSVDTKSIVKYLIDKSSDLTNIHVSGSVSNGLLGEELTEIFDLHKAGIRSLSNGDFPISSSDLLIKALKYSSPLHLPIFQNAQDIDLSRNTLMHEGVVSTRLGLLGEPALSEYMTIMRDLELLRYSGGKLHFTKISTKKSVELIHDAKKEGLAVTCDVALHHLLFTDSDVGNFDVNYKVNPPLRSEEDRQALVEGVINGTIDAISSNHRPQDVESKDLEFDLAARGTISLQTFASVLFSLSEIDINDILPSITTHPREILGIDKSIISKKNKAMLTVIDPERKWIFNEDTNVSKSRNSPFWGCEMKGMVRGLINGEATLFF